MDLLETETVLFVREGNQRAFEMIFNAFYQPLCRYAYSFLNNKDEAEEVVQGSFIQVWEKRSSLEIQTSLKAYLFRMVRNTCLNVIKHEKVKQLHAKHEMAQGEILHESVHETVTSAELENKIGEAMMQLPEQCKIVFQLSRFEGLRYAEIADQLQISVKTVENQIGKALKIMRNNLTEYLPLVIFFLNSTWYDSV